MSLFDIESKKEELKKLEEQTQQESFWQQDTSISSKVLAKIKELKHKIDEFELAQNEASNLIELTELANLEVDEEVAKDIKEITKIELVKENKDKTKQYLIESEKDVDLRKILFKELAKENITIFEMKKADATLEDAFMKLIEGGN